VSDLSEALNLIEVGRLEEAREIIVEMLYRNYDDLDAWLLLTQCALDRQEYVRAVREVLRLDPESVEARRMAVELARATRSKTRDLRGSREARLRHSSARAARSLFNLLRALVVIGVGVVVALLLLYKRDDGSKTVVLPTVDPLEACARQVQSVLSRLPSRCAFLGRGEVCLANPQVDFEAVADQVDLLLPGDHGAVGRFRAFNTGVFEGITWGLAVVQAQTSFPDASTEAVQFIVTSGVRVYGFDAHLTRFSFSSNPVVSACPSVPPSGILASVFGDQMARFRVNGAEVELVGTAFLQVDVAAGLRVVVVVGGAQLQSAQTSVPITLVAGQWVSWPVSPMLEVQGTPGEISEGANSVRGDLAQLRPLAAAFELPVTQWRLPGETVAVMQEAATATQLPATPTDEPTPTRVPTRGITRTITPLPPDAITPTESSPTPLPLPIMRTAETATSTLPSQILTVTAMPAEATAPTVRPSATATVSPSLLLPPTIMTPAPGAAIFEGVWQCSATVNTSLFDYIITVEPVQSFGEVEASARLPNFGNTIVALEGAWTSDPIALDVNWVRIPSLSVGDAVGWLLLREVTLIYDGAQGGYQANGTLRLIWSDEPNVTGGLFINSVTEEEILVGFVNSCVQNPQ
jgi:hypothetical protein